MKKLWLFLLVLLFASSVFAGVISNSEVLPFTSGGVVTFTSAKVNDVTKSPPKAVEAFIFVYGASGINFTVDGTTPTTSTSGVGIQIPANGTYDIVGQENVRDFQAIGTTGTGNIYATYFFKVN